MKHKIIFKTIVGSQSYGTAVEGSDIDIKGVYIQDPIEILTFGYRPQMEVSADETYYEVRRFLELCASANPTMLELLYAPKECIQIIEPEFKYIIKNRNIFLTKGCLNSFGGYAVSQIKKASGLEKKMNWESKSMERKTPLDFCYIFDEVKGKSLHLTSFLNELGFKQEYCGLVGVDHFRESYALYYDFDLHFNGAEPLGLKGIILDDSNTVRTSSVPKELTCLGIVQYGKDSYIQHCNKYKEYQTWLKERNTQRYVDIDEHGQKVDGKNLLHCVRLIDTAKEIVLEKQVNVKRPNADYLISIRKGKVQLEPLLKDCEEKLKELDRLYKDSDLPLNVEHKTLNKILTKIREWK